MTAVLVIGVNAKRLDSFLLGVVIGKAAGASFSTRGGAGVFDTGTDGRGRALLVFAALDLVPRSRDLTFSKRPLGVFVVIWDPAVLGSGSFEDKFPVVTERVNLFVVAEWPRELATGVFDCVATRAREDFVGVMSEARLDCEGAIPLPLPADLGRGKELPSRDTGRALEASSLRC